MFNKKITWMMIGGGAVLAITVGIVAILAAPYAAQAQSAGGSLQHECLEDSGVLIPTASPFMECLAAVKNVDDRIGHRGSVPDLGYSPVLLPSCEHFADVREEPIHEVCVVPHVDRDLCSQHGNRSLS